MGAISTQKGEPAFDMNTRSVHLRRPPSHRRAVLQRSTSSSSYSGCPCMDARTPSCPRGPSKRSPRVWLRKDLLTFDTTSYPIS